MIDSSTPTEVGRIIEVKARNLWHDDVLGEGSKIRSWHHDFESGAVGVQFDDGSTAEFDAEDNVRVLRREPWLTALGGLTHRPEGK